MTADKKYNYVPRFVEVWSGAQRLSEKDVRVRRMLIPLYSIDFINLETRFCFSPESSNLTKARDTRPNKIKHLRNGFEKLVQRLVLKNQRFRPQSVIFQEMLFRAKRSVSGLIRATQSSRLSLKTTRSSYILRLYA